jgi:hypothetical protein
VDARGERAPCQLVRCGGVPVEVAVRSVVMKDGSDLIEAGEVLSQAF